METVGTMSELGARLRELRLARRLDQATVAKQTDLDRTMISRVESGARQVSAVELMRFAQALDVSVLDIMTKVPADVSAARTALAEDLSPSAANEAADRIHLDRLWADAEQLRTLGYLGPATLVKEPVSWTTEADAMALAQRVRKAGGWGVEPLGSMQDVGAAAGLWIGVEPLAAKDGLSMTPEPGFGVSIVSSIQAPGRRRMTAAHELGHHLSGDLYQADTAISQSADERERLIDRFAAELLLPQRVVRQAWEKEPSRDAAVRLAAEYRVSWSVVGLAVRKLDPHASATIGPETPTDNDFYRVCGSKPLEDLVQPVPDAWIQACARAEAESRITPARARAMSRGMI